MKRIIAILILASTLIISCACQPTPDESAVRSKSGSEMGEALGKDAQAITIDAPEHVKDSFPAKASGTEIVIDADVSYPEGAVMLSATRVSPYYPDNDIIAHMAEVWAPGAELYDPRSYYSKDAVLAAIHRTEEYMTDESLTERFGNNEEDKKSVLEDHQKQYKALLELYKSLPDDVPEKVKSDMQLKQVKYYMSKERYDYEYADASKSERKRLASDEPTKFSALAQLENGQYVSLYTEINRGGQSSCYEYIRSENLADFSMPDGNEAPSYTESAKMLFRYTEDEIVPCTISEDEAKEYALDFMHNMWENDEFAVIACGLDETDFGQKYYIVRLSRSICNLEIADKPQYADSSASADEEEEKHVRKSYGLEDIRLYITDDGVREYSHMNPLKTERTINEGVRIKPFSEIMEIYRQQSALTYDNIAEYSEDINNPGTMMPVYADSSAVNITEINLCMLKLADGEKEMSYIIVPVWKFFGRHEYASPYPMRYAAMYINAVDGTIIRYEDCY